MSNTCEHMSSFGKGYVTFVIYMSFITDTLISNAQTWINQ